MFTISVLMLSALAISRAAAQEAPQIDFVDPQAALGAAGDRGLSFNIEASAAPRPDHNTRHGRNLEVALTAGVPEAFEISLSQRATIAALDNGDRAERETELRIGRGLLREDEALPGGSSAYAFVASNQNAVTWRPDARSEFGGRGDALALQNRVEVGDLSAGVTYERNGVQASLAYVEREETARVGRENFQQDQRFTGITFTMRR